LAKSAIEKIEAIVKESPDNESLGALWGRVQKISNLPGVYKHFSPDTKFVGLLDDWFRENRE